MKLCYCIVFLMFSGTALAKTTLFFMESTLAQVETSAATEPSTQAHTTLMIAETTKATEPPTEPPTTLMIPETTTVTQTTTTTMEVEIPEVCKEYKGCFLDSWRRMFDDEIERHNDMTQEWCAFHCQDLNYKYAGLEYYNECFCGNSFDASVFAQKPENECSTPCKGDQSQKCGGPWRLSLFEIVDCP